MIRELSARGHRISLLAIVAADFDPADRAALEPFTERIVTVPSQRGRRSLRHRVQRRLGAISVGENAARRLRDEVVELLRAEPHDVVLFSGKRTYPALGAAAGLPVVADVCDATSSRIRGNLRYASIGRLPLLLAEYVEVRRVERALVRRAAHLLFASVRDRDALLDDGERDRATVLPNGVDLAFWRRPDGTPLGRDEIVFTGAMDYPPNTDAALYLIREILPRVRREIPAVAPLDRRPRPRPGAGPRRGRRGRLGDRARPGRPAVPHGGSRLRRAAPLRRRHPEQDPRGARDGRADRRQPERRCRARDDRRNPAAPDGRAGPRSRPVRRRGRGAAPRDRPRTRVHPRRRGRSSSRTSPGDGAATCSTARSATPRRAGAPSPRPRLSPTTLRCGSLRAWTPNPSTRPNRGRAATTPQRRSSWSTSRTTSRTRPAA